MNESQVGNQWMLLNLLLRLHIVQENWIQKGTKLDGTDGSAVALVQCVSTLICGVYVSVMFVNMIKLHKVSDMTCGKNLVLNIVTHSCIFILELLYSHVTVLDICSSFECK
jgi:hypothetical protein